MIVAMKLKKYLMMSQNHSIIEYTFSDCVEPSEVIVFFGRTHGIHVPQQTISEIPECPILCPTPTPTSTYDCDSPS